MKTIEEKSKSYVHGVTTYSLRFLVANNSWVVMREDEDRITTMETYGAYHKAKESYEEKVDFFKSVVGIYG